MCGGASSALSVAAANPRPNKRLNRETNATVLLLSFFFFSLQTVMCSEDKEGSDNKELSAGGRFADFFCPHAAVHTMTDMGTNILNPKVTYSLQRVLHGVNSWCNLAVGGQEAAGMSW